MPDLIDLIGRTASHHELMKLIRAQSDELARVDRMLSRAVSHIGTIDKKTDCDVKTWLEDENNW